MYFCVYCTSKQNFKKPKTKQLEMINLTFNQVIYAALIAIAGEDEEVTKKEKKRINAVFDHFLKLSSKEKKAVLQIWETNSEQEFTNVIVDVLSKYPKHDQLDAYKRIAQFINFSKNEAEKKGGGVVKDGVDIMRMEISQYWDRANIIRDAIGITPAEYASFVKRTK